MKFTPKASMYLFIQKGELQPVWQSAYDADIVNSAEEICDSVETLRQSSSIRMLDIGGGMGGISIGISKVLGVPVHTTIIDGTDDLPYVVSRSSTFSSSDAAREFLEANGVGCSFEPNGKYDIVLSLRAWCFHFPASEYMELVRRHTDAGTPVVCDVRLGVDPPFSVQKMIREGSKCNRLLMLR